ncbi:MAG: M24 family metallopeptidase C-terminal domain-containing protein, partial [Lentihominibacter sp.]
LTEDEIRYINRYHAFVEETLSPLLDEPERVWLKRQCKDI